MSARKICLSVCLLLLLSLDVGLMFLGKPPKIEKAAEMMESGSEKQLLGYSVW